MNGQADKWTVAWAKGQKGMTTDKQKDKQEISDRNWPG